MAKVRLIDEINESKINANVNNINNESLDFRGEIGEIFYYEAKAYGCIAFHEFCLYQTWNLFLCS